MRHNNSVTNNVDSVSSSSFQNFDTQNINEIVRDNEINSQELAKDDPTNIDSKRKRKRFKMTSTDVRRTTVNASVKRTFSETFSKTINASFFKKMIRDGWFFLVASFFSGFFPIIMCLISASIPKSGGEVVIAVGLLSSFQVVFNNMGFAMAMAMVLALVKLTQTRNKDQGFINEAGLIAAQFLLNLIVGALMTAVSVGLTYTYAWYNCGRPNMVLVKIETYHYI